jgi:predicted permease
MRGGALGLEGWLLDVRYALRSLRGRRQYVVLSVLTLALGIGGTTAVFGIVRAVLLEGLPYEASEELTVFWNTYDWSEAEFTYLRDDWSGFAGVAAYRSEGVFLRAADGPARLVPGLAVSQELFAVLGARPFMGQGFEPGADDVGAEPTAVLSYGLWQELGANRDMVGSTIPLDGVMRRVVGVMPRGFWFPDPSVRVWLSQPMRPDSRSGNYVLIGRRASGRAAESMAAPVARITDRLGEQFTYPPAWDKTRNAELTPLREYLLGPVRPALLATLAGMAVLLLMACANVATLMLGQLRGRSAELATRVALGAGRRRVTQQLLVESGVLALLAGLFGAAVAAGGFRLILTALPLGELAHAVSADWTLFASALGIAFGAALLIAMAPLVSLWRGDLRDALSRARSGGIGAHGGRVEDGLVVVEVALAVLVVAVAAVLIKSVSNLRAVDPGIEANGVGLIDISWSADVPAETRRQQLHELVASIGAMPGVVSAAAIQRVPLHRRGDNWGIQIEGMPDLESSTTAFRIVTRDYFSALGIPLLRGRLFDQTDGAGTEPVIIIDEVLAQRYFPNEDPIGRRIGGNGDGWARIIGVVGGVAHAGLTDDPTPGRYMLYEQSGYMPESSSLLVRVPNQRGLAAALQEAVNTIQSMVSVVAVQETTTMQSIVALAMGPTRRIMQLMTLLGGLALTLGTVGVYGVVSHFVRRRRRDWVIRMALGMRPIAAIRKVVARGATLVALGCIIGIGASIGLTRFFASLLYEVDAADPAALLASAAILITAGCFAALLPGLRASRANPAQALREGS